MDEVTYMLSRGKVLSKLDAKDGFWSIHFDTKSSYLTSLNTHKGHSWFLHMLYGLKMYQDVFQMQMDPNTNRLPGIIAIHDDICVYGRDTAEHDRILLQLMQTATQLGLAFNSSNSAICQSQISFCAAILQCRA